MLGVGTIKLWLTSEKSLTLHGVHHISGIHRNLISGSLLIQLSYIVVLESNKVIISKREMFVEKYFISEGLFKINVLPLSINKNYLFKINVFLLSISKNSFLYSNQSHVMNIESYDVWHSRLGHASHSLIIKISNLNLIPKINIDHSKCEIYAQSKQPRKHFKSISIRNIQKLEVVHSDV